MSSLSTPSSRVASSAAVVLVFGSACLCPPCPGVPGSNKAPPGDKLMLWDGDGIHDKAKGWADCDKKPDCKSVAKAAKKGGYERSGGLQFHGEGPGWIGMGWNWYGWWPEDAGDDISGHENLTFWMRVEAESEDMAPVVDSMTVGLRCSKGKKDSASVSLSKYARTSLDGEWHKIEVPLKKFYEGKEGKEFDPMTAWEFNFGTWSATPRNFNVYFDDLAVENPPAEVKKPELAPAAKPAEPAAAKPAEPAAAKPAAAKPAEPAAAKPAEPGADKPAAGDKPAEPAAAGATAGAAAKPEDGATKPADGAAKPADAKK